MSAAEKNPIEIIPWDTPISNSKLEVLSVEFDRESQPKPDFEKTVKPVSTPIMSIFQTELIVRVKDLNSNAIYQFHFDNVGAFRVLDEHGIQELYQDDVIAPKDMLWTTLKVRHHGWSKESPLSFFMGTNEGWSYMICTDWDCVEVLAKDDPYIFLELGNDGRAIN